MKKKVIIVVAILFISCCAIVIKTSHNDNQHDDIVSEKDLPKYYKKNNIIEIYISDLDINGAKQRQLVIHGNKKKCKEKYRIDFSNFDETKVNVIYKDDIIYSDNMHIVYDESLQNNQYDLTFVSSNHIEENDFSLLQEKDELIFQLVINNSTIEL